MTIKNGQILLSCLKRHDDAQTNKSNSNKKNRIKRCTNTYINIEFLFRSIVTQTQKNVNTAAWQT